MPTNATSCSSSTPSLTRPGFRMQIPHRKGWTGFGQGRDLVKLVHCSSNLLAGAALVSNSFRPFRPPADVRCRSERAGLMAGRLPQRVLRLGRHSPTVWLVTYAVERGQAASSQNSWNDFQVRAARASHACPAHSLMQVSRTSVTHRLVRALAAATAARAIAAPQADMYHSCAPTCRIRIPLNSRREK